MSQRTSPNAKKTIKNTERNFQECRFRFTLQSLSLQSVPIQTVSIQGFCPDGSVCYVLLSCATNQHLVVSNVGVEDEQKFLVFRIIPSFFVITPNESLIGQRPTSLFRGQKETSARPLKHKQLRYASEVVQKGRTRVRP